MTRIEAGSRPSPREWIMQAAARLMADASDGANETRLAAAEARLRRLAPRLAWLEAAPDTGDLVELCGRLAELERTVRAWRGLEAALASTRPAIEAAEALLAAARRPPPSPERSPGETEP